MQAVDRVVRDNEEYRDSLIRSQRGLAGELRGIYERVKKNSSMREANIALRELCERLNANGCGITAAADDIEIKEFARVRARMCGDLAVKTAGEVYELVNVLLPVVESHGLDWPANIRASDSNDEQVKKHVAAIARVRCDRWWRRQLRVLWGRQVEHEMRKLGRVYKRKSPYVSKWAFKRWLESQVRNKKMLESMEVVEQLTDAQKAAGEKAEVVNLMDAVKSSVSAPENRLVEFKVRSRGYEEVAKAMGLVGLFFTLTAPSKYHALNSFGVVNEKYNGSTPRETIEYLNKVWASIRADWHAKGYRTFGFRIAEPHHDGTPHFHFVLFFHPEQVKDVKKIFGDWALKEDGNEEGAKKHRWDCVDIDPEKGSATGYLMKYLCKNINGEAISFDFEGQLDAREGAYRVRAWASLWGIRQFQQIGCASVTVWRELRRRREPLGEMEPEEAEAIRYAADNDDWQSFVELMGGAFMRREKAAAHKQAEMVISDPLAAVPLRKRNKIETVKRELSKKVRPKAIARWAQKLKLVRAEVAEEAQRRLGRARWCVDCYEKDGIAKLKALAEEKPLAGGYGAEVKKIIGLVMRGASRAMGIIITREKAWAVQPAGEAERRDRIRAASPPSSEHCQ